MKITMQYSLVCLLMMSVASCSNHKINAAGVVAYSEHQGQYYLLLADHTGLASFRGYGAFGGSLDSGETLEEGALREFHEETACHFLGNIQAVSKQYVRNGNYVSFVVRIGFIPSEQLKQNSQNTLCEGDVFNERTGWVWVAQDALLEQLKTGDTYQDETMDLALWDKSTAIIKLAKKEGLLP